LTCGRGAKHSGTPQRQRRSIIIMQGSGSGRKMKHSNIKL